ncbi:hypothetical protein SAMN05444274_10415 [Mariniphaga anaerophila]|uniref:Serine aminopeptidase S33 domain-containing protein n=1 Tax=Mariniphaga anaerophila TaxID=1484053 RepID=A0A1M4ZPH0_9BACT|nr:alpha/beta fold hydrolase [Mariniphaga anaerophila]SHF19898.1 hypothetical protein SAMN05444274_10415 [Mariniphaga anaerophila]
MKTLIFLIALSVLSLGLSAQGGLDTAFTTSEIVLKTSTGDIHGTLTIPNHSKVSKVVLIVAGSGPTDRNCNSSLGIHTDAYKMLSRDFAKNGIASLRFDKRGIGESRQAMTGESELRFETYVTDVVSWISLLKSDKRFSSIVLLGHSEGSLIGMIAAGQTNVAGFISISGAGKPADKILQEQLQKQLPPQLLQQSNLILDSLKAGKTVSNVNPALATLFRPSVQPYMISWIKYDPTTEIGKLKIPALIIQGTTDLQVSEEDAKLLSASKPDAELLIVENMNHVLKEAGEEIQQNMATYRNPDLPLKPGLAEEIVSFIKMLK